jgi:cellobiose phosphorylase
VVRHWRKTLSAVQIETPDAALNTIANGWLVYQTIACRLWARSGTTSPAELTAFAITLADAMALVHTEPGMLRAQIALCAAVNSSRETSSTGGILRRSGRPHALFGRLLWLPLATSRYVLTTGDRTLLDETAPCSKAGRSGRRMTYYDLPSVPMKRRMSTSTACARFCMAFALERMACLSWAAAIGTTA